MEKARIFLCTEYPFYSSLLNQCVFSWSDKIATACIGINSDNNPRLLVNRHFFYSLTEHERVGLLIHELLHLAQGHLTRWTELENKHVANQTMDVAINQYIPSDMLPKGGLLPKTFGLQPGQAFEAYYIELMKQDKNSPNKNADKNALDEHDWNQVLEQEGEAAASEETTQIVAANATENAIKESDGKLPGNLSRAALTSLDATTRSKTSWKRLLRRYVGRHASDERKSTQTRLNRRLGLMAPGMRRVDSPRILIAVDNSGSISNIAASAFMSEVASLLAAVKDKVEVVFFDTQILKSMRLSSLREEHKMRHGNGGTDFNCVLTHADKQRPDLLIILSDGEAPAPTNTKQPVLWVITGNANVEHLLGTKIHINEGI